MKIKIKPTKITYAIMKNIYYFEDNDYGHLNHKLEFIFIMTDVLNLDRTKVDSEIYALQEVLKYIKVNKKNEFFLTSEGKKKFYELRDSSNFEIMFTVFSIFMVAVIIAYGLIGWWI